MNKQLVKSKLRLVFTDIDGTRYYMDERNDIVNKHGELVSLTEEYNVRSILDNRQKTSNTIRFSGRY